MRHMVGGRTHLQQISEIISKEIRKLITDMEPDGGKLRPVHVFHVDYAWLNDSDDVPLKPEDFLFDGYNINAKFWEDNPEWLLEAIFDGEDKSHEARIQKLGLHGVSLAAIIRHTKGPNLGGCGREAFNLSPYLTQKFVVVRSSDTTPEMDYPGVDQQILGEIRKLKHVQRGLADNAQKVLDDGDLEKVIELSDKIKGIFAQIRELRNFDRVDQLRLTLRRLLTLAGEEADKAPNDSQITAGDIIALPVALFANDKRPEPVNDSLDTDGMISVPIIMDSEIERIIQELTNTYGIIVAIGSGNSNLDLTGEDFPDRVGKITNGNSWNKALFQNTGVACGAIMVGQMRELPTNLKTQSELANKGTCVDAHLNGYVPEERMEHNYDLGKFNLQTLKRELWNHMNGSSAAVMHVAALVGSIQQLRLLLDWPLLKPYEARALLRQFRIQMSYGEERYVPPSILEWMIGTRLAEWVTDDNAAERDDVYEITLHPSPSNDASGNESEQPNKGYLRLLRNPNPKQ